MSSTSLQRWEYRDTAVQTVSPLPAEEVAPPPPVSAPTPGLSEEQVTARVQQALHEAEQRWVAAAEQQEANRHAQLEATLEGFARERARYFQEAEGEVVHLALAIARKILGREASLDPDLLAALVRIALDRMEAGPVVRIRVPPADLSQWQERKELAASFSPYDVAADPSLAAGDCIVETNLGTANFGLDAQFKQVEQGILDLLRLRPAAPASFHPTAIRDTGKSC